MLRHIALFKWKDDASEEQVEAALADAVARIKGASDELIDAWAAPNLARRPQGYTHVLVSDYPDGPALERMRASAGHDAALARVKEHFAAFVVLDVEL